MSLARQGCGCPVQAGGEAWSLLEVMAGMSRGSQMDEGRGRWLPWHTAFLKEPKHPLETSVPASPGEGWLQDG